MAAGRPTKYTKDMPGKLLEFVGEQGKSITQFAFYMRVSKSTVYKWAEEHSEFSDALSQAQEWSQAVWEGKLEEMMVSREVNAPLVKLYFANRFNWRDKQDVDQTGSVTLQISKDDADCL